MIIDSFSNIGKRDSNQDAFLTAEVKCGVMYIHAFHHNTLEEYDADTSFKDGTVIMIVADGMGGLDRGEQASYLTIVRFMDLIEEVYEPTLEFDEIISETITRLSAEVTGGAPDSGSTIAGCLITDGITVVFHVGDSKCIICINGEYFRTKDQTYGQELESNIITNYVGMAGTPEICIEYYDTVPDNAILFSDGLNPSLKQHGNDICKTKMSAEELCTESIKLGSTDNITCIKYSV